MELIPEEKLSLKEIYRLFKANKTMYEHGLITKKEYKGLKEIFTQFEIYNSKLTIKL